MKFPPSPPVFAAKPGTRLRRLHRFRTPAPSNGRGQFVPNPGTRQAGLALSRSQIGFRTAEGPGRAGAVFSTRGLPVRCVAGPTPTPLSMGSRKHTSGGSGGGGMVHRDNAAVNPGGGSGMRGVGPRWGGRGGKGWRVKDTYAREGDT